MVLLITLSLISFFFFYNTARKANWYLKIICYWQQFCYHLDFSLIISWLFVDTFCNFVFCCTFLYVTFIILAVIFDKMTVKLFCFMINCLLLLFCAKNFFSVYNIRFYFSTKVIYSMKFIMRILICLRILLISF